MNYYDALQQGDEAVKAYWREWLKRRECTMTNWWSITQRTRNGVKRFEVTDLRGIMPRRVFDSKREATAYAKAIRADGLTVRGER